MNEKLLQMAREAGLIFGEPFGMEHLARFDELVRADEREECAKACDEHEARLRKAADDAGHANPYFAFTAKADSVATVADDIRNRGTPKETK